MRATLVHDGKAGQTWPIGPARYDLGIAVVPTGDQFIVITGAYGPTYSDTLAVAYRIASDGQAAAGPLTLMPNIRYATIAVDKGWAIVAASRTIVFRDCIIGKTIDAGSLAATSTEQVVSTGIAFQQAASVSSDGVGYVAAWVETTPDRQTMKATRIARTGEPLDGPGIELDRSDKGVFSAPVLASQSAMTLVVWNQPKGLVAKRVDARGMVLDSQPIVIRPNISFCHPDVKWNGSAFLVVWNEGNDVFGTTVGPSGLVAPPMRIASPPSGQFLAYDNPRLACNGQQCLLVVHESAVWGADCSHGCSNKARVISINSDGSGADLTQDPIEIEDLRTSASAAAVDGGFLVVANSGWGTNVKMLTATRISAGPPIRIADTATVFRWPVETGGTISSNGKECVVSWTAANTLGAAVLDGSVVRQRTGTSDKGGAPSIAVNASGEALIVTTERDDLTAIDRVVGYEVRDFTPLPDPPPAPVNVRAFGSGIDYVVTWSEEPPTDFMVEAQYVAGGDWSRVTPMTFPGTETHASFRLQFVPLAFRVYALNAGGLSEPSAAASPIPQGPNRRRAVR